MLLLLLLLELQEAWLPQFQCLDEKDPPDQAVLGTSPVDDCDKEQFHHLKMQVNY